MPGNGTNIYQKARKEAQMIQEQAAEALYISEKMAKAWERGERAPDNETVGRMTELHGSYDRRWPMPWRLGIRTDHKGKKAALWVAPRSGQGPGLHRER